MRQKENSNRAGSCRKDEFHESYFVFIRDSLERVLPSEEIAVETVFDNEPRVFKLRHLVCGKYFELS